MYELTDRNEIEQKMKEEGNYKDFVYKDVLCEVVRIEGMGHLCGYLHIKDMRSDIWRIIDDNFHCGVTYESEEKIGFDCAHSCDILPTYFGGFEGMISDYDTYKTMKFVERRLENTVDELVKKGLI